MPKIFHPVRSRKNFDERLLKFDLDSINHDHGGQLAGPASAKLLGVISAWLVGLHDEIAPLLQHCDAQLRRSLEMDEPTTGTYGRASRTETFALTQWMLHGQVDAWIYQRALDEYDDHFAQGGTRDIDPDYFNKEKGVFEPIIEHGLPVEAKEIRNGYLPGYLALCIAAGQAERGLELYQRVGGAPKDKPSQLRTIGEFGYWGCRELAATGSFGADNTIAAGERILRRELQGNWLGHGQYPTAALWLKTLYWQSGRVRDPLQTILKAYDLMPDVSKPDFLSEQAIHP